MAFELLLAAAILVSGIFVNRMIGKWHDETIKAFRREEEQLRNSVTSALREQKKALITLRNIKAQIVNCEQQIYDQKL
ncbi:hypothetical protein [Maridesulfovibrio sp.]|uniref:hypothetical protein n=1 Tax=Maridesulfovibrio sp. TaxID=2795000 RepID=UPI002A18E38C|nr:hypothetical protein [Maridesulfovibrio sp.]